MGDSEIVPSGVEGGIWGISSPSHAFTCPSESARRRILGDLRAPRLQESSQAHAAINTLFFSEKVHINILFNTNAFSVPLPSLSTTCAEF